MTGKMSAEQRLSEGNCWAFVFLCVLYSQRQDMGYFAGRHGLTRASRPFRLGGLLFVGFIVIKGLHHLRRSDA